MSVEFIHLLNLKDRDSSFLEGLITRLSLPGKNTGHSAKSEFQIND